MNGANGSAGSVWLETVSHTSQAEKETRQQQENIWRSAAVALPGTYERNKDNLHLVSRYMYFKEARSHGTDPWSRKKKMS